MSEHLHDNEPVISATEGWQEMRSLLDQYLPAEKMMPRRKTFASYMAAASLFLLLLLTSLQLDTTLLSPQQLLEKKEIVQTHTTHNNTDLATKGRRTNNVPPSEQNTTNKITIGSSDTYETNFLTADDQLTAITTLSPQLKELGKIRL